MSEPYSIRRGAAPPKPRRRRRPSLYPLGDMRPGDYILVPNKNHRALGNYISRIAKKYEGKFVCRAVSMVYRDGGYELVEAPTPGAIEGAGIWRTE